MDGNSYKRIRMSILLFLAVLSKIVQRCNSGVVVALHLDQFINPGSRLWDGSCCNVRHGHCGPCYYEFQVCVSRQSSYHYTQSGEPYCDYGQWHTGTIEQHTDSFYLPSRFPSGHTNPLQIIVPYWEGRVRVMINVRDIGRWGYDNDLVIEYTLYLTVWNPGRTEHDISWYNWLLVRYGLRLDVQYAVYCQANYYGRFCRVYCRPPSYYDRYTCDPTTGQKICQRGYTGFDCRRKVFPTTPFRWWRTTTKRPVPPKRWTTTVAPIITATAPATASSSPSTTSTTAPVATKNTPTFTLESLTSDSTKHTSTTDTPTSKMDAPTSTLITSTSTTYMPISTTDTPTSTTDTPTFTSRIPISTTDSVTFTADKPSLAVHIPTSTTKTSAFTTYKPYSVPHRTISTTKTTQYAETTPIANPTVQTTSPQTLTTTRRVQTKTNATAITTNVVNNMSNTSPAVTESTKPSATEPVSLKFEASTHIGEHTSPQVSFSTDKYATYSTTVETTYLTTDSIAENENTQSSSATYLKSLTTMSHKYITTDDDIITEMVKASASEQYLGMKTNKSSHFPTKPSSSGEEVTTLPDLTTDSSNATTDVTYMTDFLTHASEGNYVGETSTTNDSTLNTDSTSISPSHTTLPPTPQLSKKPTDWRRLKNKTTTAMVTGHAFLSTTLASEQGDITDGNNYQTDLATQTSTPNIQDSKTVSLTFPTVTESLQNPQHGTSADGMVYTDSVSIPSSERVSIETVLVTRNLTLAVERSTTANVSSLRTTSDSSDPSRLSTSETSFTTLSKTAFQEPTTSLSSKLMTSLTDNDNASSRSSSTSKPITRHSLSISPSTVHETTLNTITQGRKPNVLQKDNFFPIRTVSPEVCWTWSINDLRTICDCGHAQLPILPPVQAYWRTSLTTGKPEFLSEKKL